LLSSAYFDYKFTDDWTKQRNIVMEEIKSRSSDIWNPLNEDIASAFFPHHRLSATWREELKCLSRASMRDVMDFNLKKLDPRVTMLLIEGDFEVGLIWPDLQKMFDHVKSSPPYEFKVKPVSLFRGPQILRKAIPASNVSKLVYVYQLPQMDRFDFKLDAIFMMMLRYFCIGYYSRLYQILREKHGLIYGLESSYELSPIPQIIPGLLEISIKVDPQHVDKVMAVVDDELERLKRFIVPRREMLRLKNNLQFQRAMEILNKKPGKFVENYARSVSWDKPVQTYTEYYDQLRKVKPSEIQGLAKRIFRPEHRLIAIGEGGQDFVRKNRPSVARKPRSKK
jgi:predicted Zn-dependent peptidase